MVTKYSPVINTKVYRTYAYCTEDKNGRLVHVDDYAALQQKLDAMAGENAALKSVISKYAKVKQDFDDFDGDRRGIAENLCEAEGALVSGIETPATDAYMNSVRAEVISEFCALIDKYGKVEPHHFDPDFADLYAKINKKLYEGILDNPAVYDMESLVDWIESGAEDSRAYADMAIIFWNEQLRSGTHDTADKAGVK